MRVGRPRIGRADAVDEMAARGIGRRPQAERPVNVEPAAVGPDGLDDRRQRVEPAGVDVAGLRAHERRPIDPASTRRSASARIRPWSSVGTRVTRSRPMPSIWRAAKIVTCDSSLTTTGISGAPNRPWRSTSHPDRASSAWRPAAIPVNDAIVAPVVNPTLDAGRQPEQLRQPGAGHLLGDRRGRPDHVQAGVLIPGAGDPVRGDRRRQSPADHEPEVAGPGARHQAALRVGGQASTTSTGSRPCRGAVPRTVA